MKVTAHIEHNGSQLYSAYIEQELPFGIIGEGSTPEEAKADLLNVYQSRRISHRQRTGQDVDLEISFVMDFSALLAAYKSTLPLAALSRLSGINKAQLSQYVCGTRNATPKTAEKIKQSVREFAQTLLHDFA